MTMIKFGTIHRADRGESLIELAHQYRLSSWRAIAYAPGNEHIRDYHGRAPLARTTQVRVPPRAYDLLKERVFALHRVRPLLEQGFAAHEAEIRRELEQGPETDFGDLSAVALLLAGLDRSVREQVARVQEASAVFVRINSELIETHLHNAPDIREYGSYVNPEAGICWLLEKRLADSWYEMWTPKMWVQRWAGCDRAEAAKRAVLYFGVIRSHAMQQVDRRLRETQAAMSRLSAESRSGK